MTKKADKLRQLFLDKCNEHDMFIEKIWDIGSIANSDRIEERWFSDACDTWWDPTHPSMSFLNLTDIDELDDDDDYIPMAMFNQIVAHGKFGYIAQINIPKRTYLNEDTYQSGGMYLVPLFYGDTMEEIWVLAIEFADTQREKEIKTYLDSPKKKSKTRAAGND